MKVSFITYADLGVYKNLKTADISQAISYFNEKGLLDTTVCRLGKRVKYTKVYCGVPLLVHVLLAGIGKVITQFPRRKIEEYVFDFFASKVRISPGVVFFHPPKFPTTIKKINKQHNCVTVGIAVNSHPEHTRLLLRDELDKQQIVDYTIDTALEADYAKEMDYLIALSKFSKETYVQNGYPEDKIYIANLDIDTKRFFPQEKKDKNFTVLFPASNIGILKGLQYVIDAWQKLDIPNKKLIILGERISWPDELEKKYSKIIREDSTIKEKNIVKNPEDYFAEASVVVLPSFTEGFSRSVAEAMSCGVPVVTTAHATDTDFFIDTQHGLLVPTGDADALQKALYYLYENNADRVKMGHAARDAILQKKSFPEALYMVYQDIMQREGLE